MQHSPLPVAPRYVSSPQRRFTGYPSSSPHYSWTTLTPALRTDALGLARDHVRRQRSARRRTLMAVTLCVLLLFLAMVTTFAITSWSPLLSAFLPAMP